MQPEELATLYFAKRGHSQHSQTVLPGDFISDDPKVIQGHGAHKKNGAVLSSMLGSVVQTNKVIQVSFPSSRYVPNAGDVVVGRVLSLQKKRWKLDLNSLHEGILRLGAINLPGDIQRKKLEADELEMRKLLSVGDIVVCEVQDKHSDGTYTVHTRNSRYGKREHGVLLKTQPGKIKLAETHFSTLRSQTGVVVGMNGYIWLETGKEPTGEQLGELQRIGSLLASLK